MPYWSLFTSTHWMAARTLLTLDVPSAPDSLRARMLAAGGTPGDTPAGGAPLAPVRPAAVGGIMAARPRMTGRFTVPAPPGFAGGGRAVGSLPSHCCTMIDTSGGGGGGADNADAAGAANTTAATSAAVKRRMLRRP